MRQLKLLSAVIDVLLLGACVTSLVLTTLAALPAPAGAAVRTGTSAPGTASTPAGAAPLAPAGWTTVFSDDFAGRAGSAPSAASSAGPGQPRSSCPYTYGKDRPS